MEKYAKNYEYMYFQNGGVKSTILPEDNKKILNSSNRVLLWKY